jgi:nucleoid DNA-binding protein
MAALHDITTRTAAKIGMDPVQLQPYVDTLLAIVADCRNRGEDVELMTFGTLQVSGPEESFRPHTSLLPPDEENEL